MRRIWLIVLILLLPMGLVSCSGGSEDETSDYLQPFTFYYRTAEIDFSDPEGLIRGEIRDLGDTRWADGDLFALYFEGPESSALTPLFPKGTELISVSRTGSRFFVYLKQHGNAPAAIDQSIACACIAKTAFQLEGITQVHFRTESSGGQVLREQTISDADILLYDSGESRPTTDLTLYFADAAGHLLPEKRTLPPTAQDQQPGYVIDQLLQEPQTAGLTSPMPQGSALLDYNVDLGICSVDFNSDFFNNRPRTEREEQILLFSIVNSLCDLDSVSQVQFYVEGQRLERYVCMDLTQPFTQDLTIAAPIREDLNEFEGTLCVPGIGDGLLHSLPVRIRMKGGVTREEALLLELFTHPEQNTVLNPAYGFPTPLSTTVSAGVCTVDFAGHPLSDLSADNRQSILRCITATLCSLPDVSTVEFTEEGRSVGYDSLAPEASWFVSVEP